MKQGTLEDYHRRLLTSLEGREARYLGQLLERKVVVEVILDVNPIRAFVESGFRSAGVSLFPALRSSSI